MDPQPKRILVVDDEENTRRLLQDILTEASFDVTLASSEQDAHQSIQRDGLPHLMLMDINLRDTSGLVLCREMFYQSALPIIVITGDDAQQAAESLKCADDFVRKPFDPDELVMRVRRVLSRIVDFSYANSPIVKVTDRLSIDLANRSLVVEGEPVRLTPTENAILSLLFKHRGQIVEIDALLSRVWQSDISNVDDRDSLRVHVHRLRNKIERDPKNPQIIVTERGVGYCFAA